MEKYLPLGLNQTEVVKNNIRQLENEGVMILLEIKDFYSKFCFNEKVELKFMLGKECYFFDLRPNFHDPENLINKYQHDYDDVTINKYLCIGGDLTGDLFLVNLADASVYYYFHEENKYEKICDSFSLFIDQLTEHIIEEDLSNVIMPIESKWMPGFLEGLKNFKSGDKKDSPPHED
ncbi:MAG: hypothetical protein NT150_05855 [Bacteroidetes bacterium]|nr:hypothetical protein [Bacteroidota bacterium]